MVWKVPSYWWIIFRNSLEFNTVPHYRMYLPKQIYYLYSLKSFQCDTISHYDCSMAIVHVWTRLTHILRMKNYNMMKIESRKLLYNFMEIEWFLWLYNSGSQPNHLKCIHQQFISLIWSLHIALCEVTIQGIMNSNQHCWIGQMVRVTDFVQSDQDVYNDHVFTLRYYILEQWT